MLSNFANERICELLKGMILFNDIPEPILSKFFARAYTLESPFYGIMNQNLMKRNYKFYSTYIKLLYKGIINKSYPPITNCTLYRGTKLEEFEINFLKNILKDKKMKKPVPIIYCTSFLSFSTSYEISENLSSRRIIEPKPIKSKPIKIIGSLINNNSQSNNNEVIIKLNPLREENINNVITSNGFLKKISFYHNEDEVLFFPFSSFELVDIFSCQSKTMIVLDYSTRFIQKVLNCVYFEISK